MREEYKEIIAKEFERCVINTIRRLEKEETNRPFHKALLSEDALVWSRFERSFSTSFGQRVIEKISKVAALAGGASESNNQKETFINIDESKSTAIENHISAMRQNKLGRSPNWNYDLNSIIGTIDLGINMRIRVISDLWWKKDGIDNYMSIKTVKPNIDQTAEVKRDLLKLKINDPSSNVYFGLYYNPYGENRKDYKWTPPMGIFDFLNDSVVLIGRDYWDTLGGMGFYSELMEIATSVGEITKERLSAYYIK